MPTLSYTYEVDSTVYITDSNRIISGTIVSVDYRHNEITETMLYYVLTEDNGMFAKTESAIFATAQEAALNLTL